MLIVLAYPILVAQIQAEEPVTLPFHLWARCMKVSAAEPPKEGEITLTFQVFDGSVQDEMYLRADFENGLGSFILHDGVTGSDRTFTSIAEAPGADSNSNLTSDVMEYAQSVDDRSQAIFFETETNQPDALELHWQKPANSNFGTLDVTAPFLTNEFHYNFELTEYAGTWTRVRRSGNRHDGTVHLTRVGAPEQTLDGNIFLRIGSDGVLRLTGLPLTNAIGQLVQFHNDDRSGYYLTDSTMLLSIGNGGTQTGTPDDLPFPSGPHRVWDMNLGIIPEMIQYDPNPDPAKLSISQDATTVTITIVYNIDDDVYLQSTPTLGPPTPTWSAPVKVGVTPLASPMELRMLKPETNSFWRVYTVRKP